MKLIDANVILRFLIRNDEEQAKKATEFIKEGAFTIPEVIPEVVYVLSGVYKVNRKEIGTVLIDFIDNIKVNDKAIIKEALRWYANTSLDYVDCVLVARHKLLDDNIATFDKQLLKALRTA